MNFRIITACASALLFLPAAFPAEDQVQQLQLQLKQLQTEFENTRLQQQQQIDALTRKLEALTNAPPATAVPAAPNEPQEPVPKPATAVAMANPAPPTASASFAPAA